MPLTPIQKERLVNRNLDEYANVKRANDYLVRQYVKNCLNDLEEVLWILDILPSKQLDKLFKPKDIQRLELLEEKILEHFDFKPTEGDKVVLHFNVKGVYTDPDIDHAPMKVSFPASPDEIELTTYVATHADIIRSSLVQLSHQDEHIYSIREFNKKMAKIAEERGQIYQVEPESFAYFSRKDKDKMSKKE
jgi:hypothetical protein